MYESILKRIKPTKEEEEKILKIVEEFIKKLNLKEAEIKIGGSFAKGTWLKNNHDIDLFALFDDDKNCSDKLEKAIKISFKKYQRIHGSRDYFSLEYKKINFEIVPVFNIEKSQNARNITDVSPLHVEYIKNNTNEKIRDEIRLTKQFLKVNECYGAETYIGGVSGYLTELIIIKYGTFENLVKNVAKWKELHEIDIEENGNFKSEQKFPLIVIDPVQPDRNAAAGLRKEKFDELITICKKYNKKLSSFTSKKLNLRKYNLIINVEPLNGINDVVGTKIFKIYEYLKEKLNEFEVKESGWNWIKKEKAVLYFKLKTKKLNKKYIHYGPPINIIKGVERFKQKYENTKIQNDRIYTELEREFITAESLVKHLIRDNYIQPRCKNIKVIK